MADIFQMLVDILNITPQQVSEYAAQGPLYQIFYLFFFPTLFIVVFIYILTSRWMSEHRGLRILISVAVYAFIILQGYYKWFVTFSKFWLFGLLILGAVWIVFRPKEGGAKGKVLSAKEGKGGALNYFRNLTGMEINPVKAAELKEKLNRQITYFEAEVKAMKGRLKKTASPEEKNMLMAELANREAILKKLLEYKKGNKLHDFERWYNSYSRLDIT